MNAPQMVASSVPLPRRFGGIRDIGGRFLETGLRALAGVTLVGLAAAAVRPGSAVHPHWLGSTGSTAIDTGLAAAFGVAVIAGAHRARGILRWMAAAVLGIVVVATARALVRHGIAVADGELGAVGWAPPTTLVALALVVPAFVRSLRAAATDAPVAAGRGAVVGCRRSRFLPLGLRLVATGAAGLALLFAHLTAVGATDYRAPADAILVLGSRVHGDGRPSGSLVDRTRSAAALWRQGLAPVVILSGGRAAEAPISEPEAMRTLALAAGVPESALVLDEGGVNTAASIRFAARLARERGWRRVLVVSHDYHLARARLLAQREGLVVRTVPADETYGRGWKDAAIAREVVALAAAWFLPTR